MQNRTRRLLFFLAPIALIVVSALWWQTMRRTVFQVIDGSIYRSGQPTRATLRDAHDRLGIRSLLNLRGTHPGLEWYREEIGESAALGITHFDLRLETDELPPRIETERFVDLLDRAPRPVLIHCEGGVHRSAWAAAVARALAGQSLPSALEELTIRKRHWCWKDRCPAHQFFRQYEAWLDQAHRRHDTATFRYWIHEVYCPPPYDAEVSVAGEPGDLEAERGSTLDFDVRVKNRSALAWRAGSDPRSGIRLGVRAIGPFEQPPSDPLAIFRTPAGPARDLLRAAPKDGMIPPGGVREMVVTVPVPLEPGLHYLQFDMVDEMVHWFSDQGRPGLIIALRVK